MTISSICCGTSVLGFNPCFGGSYIVTVYPPQIPTAGTCFNPCFGGSYIVTPCYHAGIP